MITVEQALEKILGFVHRLEPESVPIMEALGQVLDEDIPSNISVPPLDNSAMDGYAVRAVDTIGASQQSPRFLKVIDTVIAGGIPQRKVEPGTAIRIMTGAPIPDGADAVVQFENTDEEERKRAGKGDSDGVAILCGATPGLNIREAGEDIRAGDIVLRKGTLLRPSEIGVLASVGNPEVRVIRRPVVAVLATGNELVEVGQALPAGRIYNSNSYSVAALAKSYGAVPRLLGIARDNRESLVSSLRQGLTADMIVTTGGVSAGDYDMVKDVLASGGRITFWTVSMKPGKPLAFGTLNSAQRAVPLLGLPGNPVSSMVTFELYGRPAIMKMMGMPDSPRPVVRARLEGDSVKNTDGRRVYLRAVVTLRGSEYIARLTGPQGSGILTSMSRANGLLVIPEEMSQANPGDILSVIMLDWCQPIEVEPV